MFSPSLSTAQKPVTPTIAPLAASDPPVISASPARTAPASFAPCQSTGTKLTPAMPARSATSAFVAALPATSFPVIDIFAAWYPS